MAAKGSCFDEHGEGPQGPWGEGAQGGLVQGSVQGTFQDCAGQSG